MEGWRAAPASPRAPQADGVEVGERGEDFRYLPWIWLWGWGLKAVVWFKEARGLGVGAGWCGLTLMAVRRNCSSSLRRSEKDKLPGFVCSSIFWRCPIVGGGGKRSENLTDTWGLLIYFLFLIFFLFFFNPSSTGKVPNQLVAVWN